MTNQEHWLVSEQTVLGALLIDPKSFWKIAKDIGVEHFGNHEHGLFFASIIEAIYSDQPVDVFTIGNRHPGRLGYLIDLANNTAGSANIAAYAKMVVDNATLRSVNQAGQHIAKLSMSEIDEALPILQSAIRPAVSAVRSIGELLPAYHEDITARHATGGKMSGLSTGFQKLDEMTGGLQNGDLIYFAARPSMGKTALLMQIMHHIAESAGPVLVFSMEMSAPQIVGRMVSMLSGISALKLRSPSTIEEIEWPRYTQAMTRMSGLPIHIDDRAAMSIQQVQATARMYRQTHGIVAVGLDYVQLMKMLDYRDANGSISQISAGLKQMAKDLGLPVVALSQLNRLNESKDDKRPTLAGLRASGSLEQDADIAGLLHRQEYYDRNTHLAGFAELNIAKQRNGPTGIIPLKAELQYSRFLHADSLPEDGSNEVKSTRRPTSFRRPATGNPMADF